MNSSQIGAKTINTCKTKDGGDCVLRAEARDQSTMTSPGVSEYDNYTSSEKCWLLNILTSSSRSPPRRLSFKFILRIHHLLELWTGKCEETDENLSQPCRSVSVINACQVLYPSVCNFLLAYLSWKVLRLSDTSYCIKIKDNLEETNNLLNEARLYILLFRQVWKVLIFQI